MDVRDNKGRTPLFVADESGRTMAADALRKAGAPDYRNLAPAPAK